MQQLNNALEYLLLLIIFWAAVAPYAAYRAKIDMLYWLAPSGLLGVILIMAIQYFHLQDYSDRIGLLTSIFSWLVIVAILIYV